MEINCLVAFLNTVAFAKNRNPDLLVFEQF